MSDSLSWSVLAMLIGCSLTFDSPPTPASPRLKPDVGTRWKWRSKRVVYIDSRSMSDAYAILASYIASRLEPTPRCGMCMPLDLCFAVLLDRLRYCLQRQSCSQ